jgi:hypothetical protein
VKTLFILSWLALLGSPMVPQTPAPDEGPIKVLSFKWSKIQPTNSAPGSNPLPARAVNQNDKNFDRNARVNDPSGMRDPNADTLDVRGQELEKNARSANNPAAKSTGAFAYQAKIKNTGQAAVEIVFWEYQFVDAANPANITRRQFVCGINLKPDKDKELQAFSSLGAATVSATAASSGGSGQDKVLINRVQFSDGNSWMRKDWNAAEIMDSYKRVMARPWSPNEMCRGL